MRKHVDGLYLNYLVISVEQLQVACLCGRIATDVDDALWCCPQDGFHHVGVHAGTRGVANHDVRVAVTGYEIVGQDVLHVACIEQGVVDMVDLRVDFGILDSLRHILDTDDLACLPSHEVGNGASAGVKVVDEGMVDGEW